MTVEEKIALVSGTKFMYTNGLPWYGVPSLCMADGPHGLRKQAKSKDNGAADSLPSTAFPVAAASANGWNRQNLYRMGQAIGRECKHYGVNVLLGPGVNIKRNPLCGRNFEYFSEDPLLSGEMGAAMVQGVQSTGVGACVKHFALNNSENYRFMGDSVADERAMREIYLKSFERVVTQAKPVAIMSAYNKINGVYCSQNGWLLQDVLRGEWGFDGLVMTDWGGMHDRVAALKAGCDLEMPGDTAICRKWIYDAVTSGEITYELDVAAQNALTLAARTSGYTVEDVDFAAHHALAGEIAADCAVLLKNDGLFPLRQQKLLVVGELFDLMRYQGSGSSMIHPTQVTGPKQAFDQMGVDYDYLQGYNAEPEREDDKLLAEVQEKLENYDCVLAFIGLTDFEESEGADREHLHLPENQLALMRALTNSGKKVGVVLFGGAVVSLPFADQVNAILHMFLPGQNGGSAVAQLLFGEKSPSGRLAESWVYDYADVPFGGEYANGKRDIYRESVLVGYRYHTTANKPVRYPFGYGLSYTDFAYTDVNMVLTEKGVKITCLLTNTGKYDGAEVAQAYASMPQSGALRPKRWLVGFEKVYLRAGESAQISLQIPFTELKIYDIAQKKWLLEGGDYIFALCKNCEQPLFESALSIVGDGAPTLCENAFIQAYYGGNLQNITDEVYQKASGLTLVPLTETLPLTMDSRFTDFMLTRGGRLICKTVLSYAKILMANAKRKRDKISRRNAMKGAVFIKRVLESGSVNSMTMSVGKLMTYPLATAMLYFANGKPWKALAAVFTRVKAPKIPKKQKTK